MMKHLAAHNPDELCDKVNLFEENFNVFATQTHVKHTREDRTTFHAFIFHKGPRT